VPTYIQSRLHDAITVFGRFLRQAGCQIGTGEIMSAIEASSKINLSNQEDFRHALKTCFITDHKMIPLFDQLFNLYWRNPDRIENVSDILRKLYEPQLKQEDTISSKDQVKELYKKRIKELHKKTSDEETEEKELDVFLYSPEEVLREKRFDAYTSEEYEEAKKFISKWKWEFGERTLRRLQKGSKPYRFNIRDTIRNNIFPAQDFIELHWKNRKTKQRPLVILTDISGSMDHYSRILLHFIFTVHSINKHLEAFTFGTRLTRITHYLRKKDANDALEFVNEAVQDWSGGTKIGETLAHFNRIWARRVLSGGAVVLIISDGWDTGNIELLNKEADRLHRSCHRLIWLNPNLGYEDFQPLTHGLQAIQPHVDEFLPIHNLNSLTDLVNHLSNLRKRSTFKALA